MKIKEYRKALGLTQKQLSELFTPPIPLDTIKKWDSGQKYPKDWVEGLIVEKMEEIKMVKKISNEIATNNPQQWKFIVDKLSKECIEEIIISFYGVDKHDAFDMFGLEKEVHEIELWEKCRDFLVRKASKEMWKGFSKEQINNLLHSMYAVGATSILLQDGASYTTEEIVNTWKVVNGKEA